MRFFARLGENWKTGLKSFWPCKTDSQTNFVLFQVPTNTRFDPGFGLYSSRRARGPPIVMVQTRLGRDLRTVLTPSSLYTSSQYCLTPPSFWVSRCGLRQLASTNIHMIQQDLTHGNKSSGWQSGSRVYFWYSMTWKCVTIRDYEWLPLRTDGVLGEIHAQGDGLLEEDSYKRLTKDWNGNCLALEEVAFCFFALWYPMAISGDGGDERW